LVAIVIVEYIVITVWPPPTTVLGWFTLFQKNMALALMDYPILDAAVIALLGPMFLALYFVLRRTSETHVTIAVPFVFAGIASYWATTTAFSMLYLSDEYATATTDAQRALFLSAGQALISTGLGGLFSSMGFFLVTIAGLIVSIAMLRSIAFNKVIAIIGIVANVLTLSNYVALAIVPTTISYFSPQGIVGGFLLFAWWVLIGLRLYQIGSSLPSAR